MTRHPDIPGETQGLRHAQPHGTMSPGSSSSADSSHSIDQLEKRPPSQVMRLKRMGAFHQSRLSFMRVLLRQLKQNNWTFSRPIWEIDSKGIGVATYSASGPASSPGSSPTSNLGRTYTLVAFAHDLPDHLRSDRVIAEAWDATFTLFDGIPTKDDLKRLKKHVPLQEGARLDESELVLSRANRSVRLFNSVTECLSKGLQPSLEEIESVGYLMRTTAVYGSGKFGAADRDKWGRRDEFQGSFQPELLSVWLIRTFTIDLVEHMARARSPETAMPLEQELRRRIGVGNSTGLGMAPFLLNHPALLHQWVDARETALARVRALPQTTNNSADGNAIKELVTRAHKNAKHWNVDHAYQRQKIKGLLQDFERLQQHLDSDQCVSLAGELPWNELYLWAEKNLTVEGQEQLVSLMLELHPALTDELAQTMQADESEYFRIDTTRTLPEITSQIESQYDWALAIDFTDKESIARVWYVSAEKLEPRLGERFEESVEPYEQPLSPGRDVVLLYKTLCQYRSQQNDLSLAQFLLTHPEHRHVIRRLQIVKNLPYAEIHDNTIASDMLPIDLLRCKLSFFGATKFDPRSDRWVRITMFQGSPFPHELATADPDDLAYPAV